jgi:hypothetical protein
MMEDFPEAEPKRFWIALGIFGLALIVATVMLVYTTITAEAQDQAICAPADILFKQFEAVVKEKIIWEGTMPVEQGVLQFVLFQNEKGNWTLFVVQEGIACLRARGEAGTPNDLGKGA